MTRVQKAVVTMVKERIGVCIFLTNPTPIKFVSTIILKHFVYLFEISHCEAYLAVVESRESICLESIHRIVPSHSLSIVIVLRRNHEVLISEGNSYPSKYPILKIGGYYFIHFHNYSSIVLIDSDKNEEKVFTKDSSSLRSSFLIANKIA